MPTPGAAEISSDRLGLRRLVRDLADAIHADGSADHLTDGDDLVDADAMKDEDKAA
jgi:hypothetical protein